MYQRLRNISLRVGLVFLMVLFYSSCAPTRRLDEGEQLLYRSKIVLKGKGIDAYDLEPYQKQSPNKTILWIKFHLLFYNLASPTSETWPINKISDFLRKIGEEPVVWDPLLTTRTSEQFHKYLQAKGFYDNVVTDTFRIDRDKVSVTYKVILNEPHRLKSIKYVFEDPGLANFVYADTVNSMMKKGDRFDMEVLEDERERLEKVLKNEGFFRFNKEYIFYEAREGAKEKEVDLKIIFKESINGIPDPVTKVKAHKQYKINSLTIFPDYTMNSGIDETFPGEQNDTVRFPKIEIIYGAKQKIKPESLLIPIRCVPDSLYRPSDVQRSYTNYSALEIFRVINIQFDRLDENEVLDTSDFGYLDCRVELTPRKTQSNETEIVGTHSAGDFGGRISFAHNNYNLLRGAENFQLKLTGALEDVSHRINPEDARLSLMKELGVESTLSLPKFLVPFRAKWLTQNVNPRTVLNLSYNFQNRPDYIRTIANASFSYRWKPGRFITHQFYPVEFNYVLLPQGIIDADLENEIEGSPLMTSFSDHAILGARYGFEFTNQVLEKKTDFIYLKLNLESAGNLMSMASYLSSVKPDTFLNVPMFRFVKGEADFRLNNQINTDNKWVYRLYAGVGYPLGHSETLPFEKMFYAGGPSGVRAWETGALGPGSLSRAIADTLTYASRLGDIKLEANLEYRFKLFWTIEGAWFIDMGNVWTVAENRPGTQFKWNSFYKDIAVGTGVGARLDFSFLIIRLDFGLKLRDPALEDGHRWIDINATQEYTFRERFNFLFGIGYPF
ncbi:MAG: BamA/TamA family outer membrane protein [Bacteroidales bacterium]|nr:BamA/TamA family outer membrane protein [Bacteroidales bacterium]